MYFKSFITINKSNLTQLGKSLRQTHFFWFPAALLQWGRTRKKKVRLGGCSPTTESPSCASLHTLAASNFTMLPFLPSTSYLVRVYLRSLFVRHANGMSLDWVGKPHCCCCGWGWRNFHCGVTFSRFTISLGAINGSHPDAASWFRLPRQRDHGSIASGDAVNDIRKITRLTKL